MSWFFLLLSALGLSVDTFVLSVAYESKQSSACLKRALAASVVFALASGLMLSLGWLVASIVVAEPVARFGYISDCVLVVLGLQLFAESSRINRVTRTGQPYRLLISMSFISAIDAAAFGATLPLSGQSLPPVLALLTSVALFSSLSGMATVGFARAWSCQTAQAYGGILMISLGASGVVFAC